jgi:Flp pilus assembly protein TadG
VLPLFVTLTLGTADGGRAFYYREAVSNAARQALRVAVSSSQQSTGDTACSGKGTIPSSVSTTLPALSTSTIFTIANAAALESSSTGLAAGTAISGATLTVKWHCSGSKAITNSTATTNDPASTGSDSVEVTITYPFTLITPLVSRLMNNGNPTIGADVFGRSEY